MKRGISEKGLSVTKPICRNKSESIFLFVWEPGVAVLGWLEFGLAGLAWAGGGQECEGVGKDSVDRP